MTEPSGDIGGGSGFHSTSAMYVSIHVATAKLSRGVCTPNCDRQGLFEVCRNPVWYTMCLSG
jgi:hypothetical protein